MDKAIVVSVNSSSLHGFSKSPQSEIRLVEGIGVEGDAHAGRAVQHLHPNSIKALSGRTA
jgi:hypothetical protein